MLEDENILEVRNEFTRKSGIAAMHDSVNYAVFLEKKYSKLLNELASEKQKPTDSCHIGSISDSLSFASYLVDNFEVSDYKTHGGQKIKIIINGNSVYSLDEIYKSWLVDCR